MRPARRPPHSAGLYFDDFAQDSAWIRDRAHLRLPPLSERTGFVIRGEIRPHPGGGPAPGLDVRIGGKPVARLAGLGPGPFRVDFTAEPAVDGIGTIVGLGLLGVSWTNLLAWLGRVAAGWPLSGPLQRFRRQDRNRQLRILRVETAAGEVVFDFANRHAPLSPAFARRHTRLGLNVAGYLTADLGVGESARCMVRAADAAGLDCALVDLRLPCKNPRGDLTYADRLRDDNPYAVNVVHLDPPGARDLDHHHPGFRNGRTNVGYWAWELPEFPDDWLPYCDYFDEIWAPSDFTRSAIGLKSPVPVLTMPHSIAFAAPGDPPAALRARFGLPSDAFLFLTLFDLNSYAERKNPWAVLAAFEASGLAGKGAALVVKVHNAEGNPAEFARLRAAASAQTGVLLVTETLPRADVYALEAACDALVSLHRAEGFGLAVAECMALGKPVISTDWSATAEYLTAENGCPVRSTLVALDRHHGPYTRGQIWAEPDAAHAADWMRRLFSDRDLGVRLGKAARSTVEERFAPAVIGRRYRRRLEAIAAW
jgi:glycosyltransferase involved in cell wall biosynthesis